jgi:hypothetical protein
MGMMIVRHKVRDYGQWRPVFDQHAEMQREAGLINPRVYHSADSNKSEIRLRYRGHEEGEGVCRIARPQRSNDCGWCPRHPNNLFSRINRLKYAALATG